jgi:hypothetical protein
MTNQQLFDKVVNHLLTQLVRSEVDRYSLKRCLYFGPNGIRCAIGALMQDTPQNRLLEGKSAADRLVLQACGLEVDQHNLASDLQWVHDNQLVAEWETELQLMAKKYNLEWNWMKQDRIAIPDDEVIPETERTEELHTKELVCRI